MGALLGRAAEDGRSGLARKRESDQLCEAGCKRQRRQTVSRQVCLEVGGKRFVTSPLTLRALGPSYFDLLLDDNELAASRGGEDELLPPLEFQCSAAFERFGGVC